MSASVFPLAMVRNLLRITRNGYLHSDYKSSPRLINEPAPKNVHCGSYPLVRHVYIYAVKRFDYGSTCYINTAGEFVYPA